MAQETQHTPGPWRFCEPDQISRWPVVQRGMSGGFQVKGDSPERTLADAKLIAAAPELLVSLKEMLVLAEGMSVELDLPGDPGEFRRARAAVAKAEGQAI